MILVLSSTSSVHAAKAMGGAACVMAKWQGTTLDYQLIYGKQHPSLAQEEAERLLIEKGTGRHKTNHVNITHNQAASNLSHAFVTVIKSSFKTNRGRDRVSYGCGFSGKSKEDSLLQSIIDLQTYSWGWVPDRDGYDIVKRLRY